MSISENRHVSEAKRLRRESSALPATRADACFSPIAPIGAVPRQRFP
jgi:hypothetical protein